MSHENVEIVRRVYDATLHGETERVIELLDLNLRGFHGLDAYRLLRERGATMPVIVVPAPARLATAHTLSAKTEKPRHRSRLPRQCRTAVDRKSRRASRPRPAR